MSDQLSIFDLPTFEATAKSTCSRASESGATPCDGSGGLTTASSGPEVAHARPSRRPEKLKPAQAAVARTLSRMLGELASSYAAYATTNGLPTSGTYGRKCGDSSATAALQSSWESKLRAQTDAYGSRLFALRWKS